MMKPVLAASAKLMLVLASAMRGRSARRRSLGEAIGLQTTTVQMMHDAMMHPQMTKRRMMKRHMMMHRYMMHHM